MVTFSFKMLKEPPGRVRYLEKEEIERPLKAIESLPQFKKIPQNRESE